MGLANNMFRVRALFVLLMTLTCVTVVAHTMVPVAMAQEEGGEGGGGETATTEEEEAASRPLLLHILYSAGLFFGIVMFGLSIVLVTLIVLSAMDLRMGAAIPPAFVDDFTDLVNKRQFKQAFELCREDTSYLARVMSAGMSRLQYGIEDAREASVNQVEAIKSGKESLTNYLGTIGTIAPLLGLLGTVWGMIKAFRRLAAGETAQPKILAGDISQALVTTLLGIFVAAPAIFFYAFFRGRLNRMANEVSNLSDDLLTQMYHNSRRAAGGQPGAPAPQQQPASRG